MTARIDYDSEIACALVALRDTMAKIDAALDRGDRRAFRAWSKRWASVSARGALALVQATNS